MGCCACAESGPGLTHPRRHRRVPSSGRAASSTPSPGRLVRRDAESESQATSTGRIGRVPTSARPPWDSEGTPGAPPRSSKGPRLASRPQTASARQRCLANLTPGCPSGLTAACIAGARRVAQAMRAPGCNSSPCRQWHCAFMAGPRGRRPPRGELSRRARARATVGREGPGPDRCVRDHSRG